MEKFTNLKAGEILSEQQYYTVIKKVGDKVQLKNDLNENIVVDSKYVETCLTSGVQYTKEEKLNKTELANLFLSNPYTAMTANFNKQVKEADVVKEIMTAYEGSTPKTMQDAVKRAVKNGLEGEERTIVGRHTGHKDDFGRVNFTDMQLPNSPEKGYDTRLRLVDPRTLNWLILRGTKYLVK